jgi:hypothetical protein
MNSGKQFYLQKLQKMPKYKLNQGCERFLQWTLQNLEEISWRY